MSFSDKFIQNNEYQVFNNWLNFIEDITKTVLMLFVDHNLYIIIYISCSFTSISASEEAMAEWLQ